MKGGAAAMGRTYRVVRTASRGEGKVAIELPLPIEELVGLTHEAVQELAGRAGILIMQAAIDEEVNRLVGARHERRRDREASRWGRQRGAVVLGGQKVSIERPRVRRRAGGEVPLSTYAAFQREGPLEATILDRLTLGLSTRHYARTVKDFVSGYGVSRSSVSRRFIRASAEKLRELMDRRLGDLGLVVLVIDGIEVGGEAIVAALGIAEDGKKHVLGLWQGPTENATVVEALLRDLVERGLSTEEKYLFVIDGSKALEKGIKAFFGKEPEIQRCTLHKRRNVKEHLPEEYHAAVDQRLRTAYGMVDYEEAKGLLEKTVAWLEKINPSAARSLDEGLEKTLTLHRLEVPEVLRRSLSTTNVIESIFSRSRDVQHRVKRWRKGAMAARWAATALLDAESRFRRIKGHRAMPALVAALRPCVAAATRSA